MDVETQTPRLVAGSRLLLAGIFEPGYDRIATAWQRFGAYAGIIPGRVGSITYGVKANSDDGENAGYIAAIEVSTFDLVPAELTRLLISPAAYAVFEHRGHVSTIRSTFEAIYDSWLPHAGLHVAGAPDFERYDERFNPHSGEGVVELWIPVTAAARR